jgi:NADH:ubiquinone oxidoreductase subunit 2 (subunit N)
LFLIIIFLTNFLNSLIFFNIFSIFSIILKLGIRPFHFWFISVIENISWLRGFILLTWQKLIPLFILSKIYQNLILFFIILRIFFRVFRILNSSSIRKILTLSSISHITWIRSLIFFQEFFWINYLLIYRLIFFLILPLLLKRNFSSLRQISFFKKNENFLLIFNFWSLGGLPPLIGFFPKISSLWIFPFFNNFFLVFRLIFNSLLRIYIYTLIFIPNLFLKKIFFFSFFSKKLILSFFFFNVFYLLFFIYLI